MAILQSIGYQGQTFMAPDPSNMLLTGLDTSQGGNVTASDTVLSAIGKMQHGTEWAITDNNEYGGIYWRVRDNVLYLCSGVTSNIIPAKTLVRLCTLPDGVRGGGGIYVPCIAGYTIPGALELYFPSGAIFVIFAEQVNAGERLYVNLAAPAS